MAAELSGKTFVFYGRLARITRREAVRRIEMRGAVVRRGLTQRGGMLVIGQGARLRLHDGGLARMLEKAGTLGFETLSERTFLALIGLDKNTETIEHAFSLDEAAARAGLEPSAAHALALFDVVVPRDGRVSFRDLIALKDAAKLLADGVALDAVIESFTTAQSGAREAEVPRLVRAADGSVKLRVGESLAEFDGQIQLPLPDAANPSVDDLFHAAEDAEEAGDFAHAERLYRRCVDRDPRDPSAPFNLANVLREKGKHGEARLFFQVALSIDPRFAEASYNLADLAEADGNETEAIAYLERAVEADSGYADAIYNLARLSFRAGAYREALGHWERYVAFDSESAWSKKAREGILLCRQQLA
jgi:tetratricopeptide (TPR) repeat protein